MWMKMAFWTFLNGLLASSPNLNVEAKLHLDQVSTLLPILASRVRKLELVKNGFTDLPVFTTAMPQLQDIELSVSTVTKSAVVSDIIRVVAEIIGALRKIEIDFIGNISRCALEDRAKASMQLEKNIFPFFRRRNVGRRILS